MKILNFPLIFELKLFVKNRLKCFSPFFLEIHVRADERKIALYQMPHSPFKKPMKKSNHW